MHWLSLDLDGTLAQWPYRHVIAPHMKPLLERAEVRQALRREYQRRIGSEQPHTAFDWEGIHKVVRLELNLAESFPNVTEILAAATLPAELVYPEVPGVLRRFRAAGWGIAIATNGFARYQQVLVDKLGLPYDRMVAPDLSEAAKPHADFWRALKDGGPTSVVHVGDLVSQDIWGANNAGITAAWVWREMPQALRAVPVAERAGRAEFAEALRKALESELTEHGYVGATRPADSPRPDLIVADFDELAQALL